MFGLNSLLIGALFISCHKKSDLESALPRAGDNRPELEKALQRYQSPKDSLKRQAAEFLIANMPGHFSFDSSSLKYYRPILHLYDSFYQADSRHKCNFLPLFIYW
ncbi:MAG: hypothetical protein CRN43_17960 [Candidatus Nephrothrix sp. EaCA]|nr:MAG: hypothetical protein CRN43_17960 [Candidatus Nephrothrix sp. EaCA]